MRGRLHAGGDDGQQDRRAEPLEEVSVRLAGQAAASQLVGRRRADVNRDAGRGDKPGPDHEGACLADRGGAAILSDQLGSARDKHLAAVKPANVSAHHGADRSWQVRVDRGLQNGRNHKALRHHAREIPHLGGPRRIDRGIGDARGEAFFRIEPGVLAGGGGRGARTRRPRCSGRRGRRIGLGQVDHNRGCAPVGFGRIRLRRVRQIGRGGHRRRRHDGRRRGRQCGRGRSAAIGRGGRRTGAMHGRLHRLGVGRTALAYGAEGEQAQKAGAAHAQDHGPWRIRLAHAGAGGLAAGEDRACLSRLIGFCGHRRHHGSFDLRLGARALASWV